jgi:hypothetical protein
VCCVYVPTSVRPTDDLGAAAFGGDLRLGGLGARGGAARHHHVRARFA